METATAAAAVSTVDAPALNAPITITPENLSSAPDDDVIGNEEKTDSEPIQAIETGRENMVENNNKQPASAAQEDLIRTSLGPFGWTTIDGVCIAYLIRDEKRYVAVRMVETKLLSRFPSKYPPEIAARAPLMSHYVTDAEAALLNNINNEYCDGEFGQSFEKTDLIVQLADFIDFYAIVKKHFPEKEKNKKEKAKNEAEAKSESTREKEVEVTGGWIQLENTLVPYVNRRGVRLVPLSVIRYAAGFLNDVRMDGILPNEKEEEHFNRTCAEAGLDFKFNSKMQLVSLENVRQKVDSAIRITDLPEKNPFAHAKYVADDPPAIEAPTSLPPPPYIARPPMQLNGGTTLPLYAQPLNGAQPPAANGMPPFALHEQRQPMMLHHPANQAAMFGQRSFNGQQMPPQRMMQHEPPHKSRGGGRGSSHFHAAMRMQQQQRLYHPSVPTRGFVPRVPEPARMAGSGHFGPPSELDEMRALAMRGAPRPPHGAIPMIPRSQLSPSSMNHFHRTSPPQISPLAVGGMPQLPSPQSAAAGAAVPTTARGGILRPATQSQPSPPGGAGDKPKNIKPVDFHGKKISCLVKESSGEKLALVEAVARVFFPACKLNDFVHTLESVLHLRVDALAPNDEKSFIQFYGLPTNSLICNKVVNLDMFEKHLPQLKAIFKEQAQQSSEASRDDNRDTASQSLTSQPNTTMSNSPLLTAHQQSSSTSSAIYLARKRTLDSGNSRSHGNGSGQGASKPKKVNRLDDILNRLKNAGQNQ